MTARVVAAVLAALAVTPLAACGSSSTADLRITQTTDAAVGADHRGHVVPGTFVGITISIQNTGAGAARGLMVRDILPAGFHFYEETTVGGDAIRTATDDPAAQGDPQWGTWTLPPAASGQPSTLVISFTAQAANKPGQYQNLVDLQTTPAQEVQQGAPAVVVVDPRPSLALTVAATSPQTTSGGSVTYVLSVSNMGSAPAAGVTVSVSLPAGFLYQSTSGFEGNGTRSLDVDPPANSLLPVWASWSIPPAAGDAAGLLRVTFQAHILPGVQAGVYSLAAGLSADAPVVPQTLGQLAPVVVGKATTVPVAMRVAASSPYVHQGGVATYVITVENDSVTGATGVVVTDTLPQGFTYAGTTSVSVNGQGAGSRLQPGVGSATPQWGPFTIPAGGLNGATLTITFTANVAPSTALGQHANVVSGNATNAQITGGSDALPITVTAS